jgi:hypothetical protein
MGLFGSLFGGKKKKSSGLPPEIERIFEKISRLMEDEKQQNSMYPPQIRDQIVGGHDVDELPYGEGDFGRTADNPIPVNGSIGELIYLSSLKTSGDARVLYHRLGSIDGIDIYETVSIDGQKWDLLFFSMYHPRKSRKSPSGYSIIKMSEQPLLYGTNSRVDNFPYGLQEAIRNTTAEIFGVPMPPPQVREAEEKVQFSRPGDHQERAQSTLSEVSGFRSTQ